MLLKIQEVAARVRLSPRTIYRMIAIGEFPAGYRIGLQNVAWKSEEIDHWYNNLEEADEYNAPGRNEAGRRLRIPRPVPVNRLRNRAVA